MIGFISKIARAAMPIDSPYGPESLRKLQAKFGLAHKVGTVGDFSSDAFNKYVTDRVQNISQLKTSKTPAGDLISEKLSKAATDASKSLTTQLNNVFAATPDFNTAKTAYEATLSHFQGYAKKNPEKELSHFYGILTKSNEEATNAIKDQQKKEMDALKEVLQSNEEGLMASLEVTKDQFESVKSSIKKNLETMHKEQLGAFETAYKESIRKLLDPINVLRTEHFLATDLRSAHGSSEMKKLIELATIENRKKLGKDIATTVTVTPDGADISSVSLKLLDFIQRVGGEKITNNKAEPPVYTLKMGWKVLNPRYYLFNNDKKDLQLLAKLVYVSGSKTILMKPKSDSLKDARMAFDACINAGFAPGDITIEHPRGSGNYLTTEKMDKAKVNGKECKTESIREVLYKDHPSEYANLEKLSGPLRAELKEITEYKPDTSKEYSMSEIKAYIQTEKAKVAAAADTTADTTASPTT